MFAAGGETVAFFGFCGCVEHPFCGLHGAANFDAVGSGDEPLGFDVLPGSVVAFGADE